MEKRTLQLETKVGILEQEIKLLRDQISSNKSQKVMNSKSTVSRPIGKQVCDSDDISFLPPEMLQMIMKRLDIKSLKNCRLVWRSWNVQATPVLANRSSINLCKFFPCDDYEEFSLTFPKKITPGLIKNIHAIRDHEDKIKLLTAFCEKYGKQVKGLIFRGLFFKDNENLLLLHRVLTELCLNLEDLFLFEISRDNEHENITQTQKSFEFSNPLALKVLQLQKDFDDEEPPLNVLPLSSFFNNLILASRRLESLNMNLEYCPKDLSKQISLKTLYLMRMSFSEIRDIQFPYKNCIENLIVFVPPPPINSKGKTSFKYQQFPVLRNLTIKSHYDGVPQPSNFAYFMLERSPLLESLTVKGYGTVEKVKVQMTDLFHTKSEPDGSYPHLATLKFLAPIEDQEFFESIVNLTNFPNLTTLEFSIGDYASLTDLERGYKISNWFKILSKLKLVHLALNLECNIKMSDLADGISGYPSLFRGLETIKITYDDGDFGADDLHGSQIYMGAFQMALRWTSTLKKAEFVGFQMRGSTSKNLMDFVKKNRLPVTID